ncbi:uncharacterized protein EI97DRAFT_470929 [Westerdykella ornata]|uniref:UBC core domain-containing protein n=1 Tax=Westerdykella ornata TaxID=318751 RepID=A0A6A6J573_WESOR|nr:uncharacterized protein EI97DRAFT_470929 [Westerdykella ornata]KAF2271740.1 hypothetical protein EI97DRAFT_470929 [Westerdykella ornata]
MANQAMVCCEDTVSLKEDKLKIGVVDRTFGDIDSHEPRPQRDYLTEIVCDDSIPKAKFESFLRSGVPPRDTALVSWQTENNVELIPVDKLEVLDRALYVGDVVKRNQKDAMSGTVVGNKTICSLLPAARSENYEIPPGLDELVTIHNVPSSELLNVHAYNEGALVVYKDWVGKIEDVFDEVAVRLSNNSVVVVEDPEELVLDGPHTSLRASSYERWYVGDIVKTKKYNLRRGKWIYGSFNPNIRPQGIVVQVRTIRVTVRWLARRFGRDPTHSNAWEPPTVLELDELESPEFRIYDASGAVADMLPHQENGAGPSYHVAEVCVGDRVRFKDVVRAAAKYDEPLRLPNNLPQGKLQLIPRTETLGYDMNVYMVAQTHSRVMVQWQDLTVTEESAKLLVPDHNVGDEDEVWPGEIVFTREEHKETEPELQWTNSPAKVGIVQAIKSRDRIATVRWFDSPLIRYFQHDLIPPTRTGELKPETEDVSLYDIQSHTTITRRRGDFVIIHKNPSEDSSNSAHDWFGEVVDLGLDGKLVVRLGASPVVRDVKVSYEDVTLVYSGDDELYPLADGIDGEPVGSSDDGVSGSDEYEEMWIEYEGMDGEPINSGDEHDWSTEEEDGADDDEEDESMPDLEPPESRSRPGSESPTDISSTHIDLNGDHSLSRGPVGASTEPPSVPAGAPPNLPDLNTEKLSPFVVLDTQPPSNHHYLHESPAVQSKILKRIAKEHKILRTSLPPGILVRTWESRLDLIRVLMIGPSDTPYEFAPFMIDLHVGASYPLEPPRAYFHSWTDGMGPVNPNLYEDGKICLSLLGTWHTDEHNESWSPDKSTLLQVLVSIHSLVLVKEPYYNEAGFDIHRGAPETKLNSALYTERAYFRARAFIVYALTHPSVVDPFRQELEYMYLRQWDNSPQLLNKAIAAAKEILVRSETDGDEERDGLRRISRGATVMLKRQVEQLEKLERQTLSY